MVKVFFGVEADKTLEVYGGTPGDLILMIVQRGPAEWADYVSAIAPLYIEYGVAEKLGKGITQSIQFRCVPQSLRGSGTVDTKGDME